jgi:pimeloyl-ACP methyl ester carboxylesterase
MVAGVVLISTAPADVDPVSWLPAPVRPAARLAAPTLLRGTARGRRAELIERFRHSAGDLAFLSTKVIAFGDPDISPAAVDFLERTVRATPIDVIADFFLALRDHDKRSALPVLGRVPVSVIIGAADRMIPQRQSEELAAAIPDATLVVVPGAGHAIILERPDIVTEEISDLTALALDATRTRRHRR